MVVVASTIGGISFGVGLSGLYSLANEKVASFAVVSAIAFALVGVAGIFWGLRD